MSEAPARLDYGTSNAVSPEENILRGMFTFFLNSGAFDGRMRDAALSPESARTDHVGVAFLRLHREELRDEFLAWARSDALASFLLNEGTMQAARDRFKAGEQAWSHSPLDAILGARFKLITGFDRKRMPRDLKKSFYTRAYNRLVKFVGEYSSDRDSAGRPGVRARQDPATGKARELSVEDWLRLALSKEGKKTWFQSEQLREIRNLYQSTMRHEPVEDVVRELMNQAAVAGVMLS